MNNLPIDLAEILLKPNKSVVSQPPKMPSNGLSWGRPLPKPQAMPPKVDVGAKKKTSPIPLGSEYTSDQATVHKDTYLQVLCKKGGK